MLPVDRALPPVTPRPPWEVGANHPLTSWMRRQRFQSWGSCPGPAGTQGHTHGGHPGPPHEVTFPPEEAVLCRPGDGAEHTTPQPLDVRGSLRLCGVGEPWLLNLY